MTAIDAVLDQLEAATKAGLALARELAAARREGDEWLRMPAAKGRCQISHMSRSSLNRQIIAGKVRAKSVRGLKFYSGADVRRLLNE
jgi:hypothetical protein